MHANGYRYFLFFVVGLRNDYIDKKTWDIVLNKNTLYIDYYSLTSSNTPFDGTISSVHIYSNTV